MISRIAIAVLLLSTSGVFAAEPPDFSGSWRLNDELSDDVREKMHEEMERRRARGFGGGPCDARGGFGGPGGRGPGGPGARGGRAPEGRGPDGMQDRLARLEQGVEAMTIVFAAPRLDMVYADQRERTLYTDGRKQARSGGVGPVETRASWTGDGELVVKMKTEQGRQVTERWELVSGKGQLRVTVSTKGRGPKLVYTRIYDPVSPEEHDGEPTSE